MIILKIIRKKRLIDNDKIPSGVYIYVYVLNSSLIRGYLNYEY